MNRRNKLIPACNVSEISDLFPRDYRNFVKISDIKKVKKPLKYRNHKCEYSGIKFDSKKEMERYLTLKICADKGIISDLNLQVPFLLVPKNEEFRGAYYRADFTYMQDGNLIVEDVKSPITRENAEYKLKKKLMFHVHKIKIKEI